MLASYLVEALAEGLWSILTYSWVVFWCLPVVVINLTICRQRAIISCADSCNSNWTSWLTTVRSTGMVCHLMISEQGHSCHGWNFHQSGLVSTVTAWVVQSLHLATGVRLIDRCEGDISAKTSRNALKTWEISHGYSLGRQEQRPLVCGRQWGGSGKPNSTHFRNP